MTTQDVSVFNFPTYSALSRILPQFQYVLENKSPYFSESDFKEYVLKFFKCFDTIELEYYSCPTTFVDNQVNWYWQGVFNYPNLDSTDFCVYNPAVTFFITGRVFKINIYIPDTESLESYAELVKKYLNIDTSFKGKPAVEANTVEVSTQNTATLTELFEPLEMAYTSVDLNAKIWNRQGVDRLTDSVLPFYMYDLSTLSSKGINRLRLRQVFINLVDTFSKNLYHKMDAVDLINIIGFCGEGVTQTLEYLNISSKETWQTDTFSTGYIAALMSNALTSEDSDLYTYCPPITWFKFLFFAISLKYSLPTSDSFTKYIENVEILYNNLEINTVPIVPFEELNGWIEEEDEDDYYGD